MLEICIEELMKISNQQFKNNSQKNLFCTSKNQISFYPDTKRMIQTIQQQRIRLSIEEEQILLLYFEKKFLLACYAANPYINFSKNEKLDIQKIYRLLMNDIFDNLSWKTIENFHFGRIRALIKKTNLSTYQINNNSNTEAKQLVCSDYSSELQIDVMRINENSLMEPILDIGCGEHGNLVRYFREHGREAYGIDRLQRNHLNMYNSNWLEFDYGEQKWGTIISHLSFTNHFLYHYQQNDGIDISYAKIYMNILQSLRNGGTWFYVPSIPLIEDLLPKEKYELFREPVTKEVSRTQIRKINL